MAVNEYFWLDIVDRNRNQTLVTPERVAERERELGIRLPECLVRVLKARNGGWPRNPIYFIPAKLRAALPRPTDDIESALDRVKIDINPLEWIGPFELDGVYHFADDVDNKLCLDYRKCGPNGEPSVAVYFALCTGETYDDVFEIAESVSSFFGNLESAELCDVFGISSNAPLEWLWECCASALDLHQKKTHKILGRILFSGEHRTWKSPANLEASVGLEPNEDLVQAPGFPQVPECNYLLRAEIHPRHRDELFALVQQLPFESKLLYQVNWNRWPESLFDNGRSAQ